MSKRRIRRKRRARVKILPLILVGAVIAGVIIEMCIRDRYSVEIPVITAWVRDDNYVHSTKEIFLGEPSLEAVSYTHLVDIKLSVL